MSVLFGVLQDRFTVDSLPTVWTASYGGAAVSGGKLVVPCTTSYAAGQTAANYVLNGSGVAVEVVAAVQGGATVEAYTELLVLSGTAGTDLGIHYNAVGGLMSMVVRVGYVDADQLEVVYDPVAHRWWRVLQLRGVLYWSTSPDGIVWKTHRTATAPAWAQTGTTLALNLGSRRNNGSNDQATFDNVNILPATFDEPDLRVEVSFGGASTSTLLHLDDPTRGKLNTGTLGTSVTETPVWTDVTANLLSGSVSRGSRRVDSPVVTYDPGTAAVVLWDLDRRFDPTNLAGPYVSGGVSQVTAMRGLRILADWAGITYEVFRGTIDVWDIKYVDPGYNEVTVSATDAFKILTKVDRTAVAPVGASETTGARIGRILDSAGWPAADRTLATGQSTVQATDLAGSALSEMQLTAASEIGELYVDGGGRVTFRGRHGVLTDTRSNLSQATFGDTSYPELPYTDLGLANDDATFFNEVRVTREGGTEQVSADAASQATYYLRTYRPSEQPILESDSDARNYADWLVYTGRDPELRFASMTVEPIPLATDLFPQVLGREIGDRVTVVRRPPGGGAAVTKDVFVRGISHEFSAMQWRTVWTFQSADKFGSFLTLDNAVLGRLDYNALAY